MDPWGVNANLHFSSPQPDSSLCCETTHTDCVVCLFMLQLSLVPFYAAWWQRHMGVNTEQLALSLYKARSWTHNFLIASPTTSADFRNFSDRYSTCQMMLALVKVNPLTKMCTVAHWKYWGIMDCKNLLLWQRKDITGKGSCTQLTVGHLLMMSSQSMSQN